MARQRNRCRACGSGAFYQVSVRKLSSNHILSEVTGYLCSKCFEELEDWLDVRRVEDER